MNSFQCCRNEKMATVVSAGMLNGTRICHRMRNELAPSISAVASSPGGMLMKNGRSRKMNSGDPPNQKGTINGFSESSQPSQRYRMKLGTIVTSQGTISVAMTSKNSALC